MKNFLGIFMGSGEPVERPDAATVNRGLAAWHKWMADNAASVVLEAVRRDLRMIVSGPEFRQRFIDEYAALAIEAFDAAREIGELIGGRDAAALKAEQPS